MGNPCPYSIPSATPRASCRFLARKFKPNQARCFSLVDETGGHPGKLFDLACGALLIAAKLKRDSDKSGTPNFQRVVDAIGTAFFAIATMLDILRSTVERMTAADRVALVTETASSPNLDTTTATPACFMQSSVLFHREHALP